MRSSLSIGALPQVPQQTGVNCGLHAIHNVHNSIVVCYCMHMKTTIFTAHMHTYSLAIPSDFTVQLV